MSESAPKSSEVPDADDEGKRYTGTSMRRVEDFDILTGRVDYIHDIDLPGCLHAALVRAPHAHAAIEEVDTSAAESHPDCELVLTAADIEEHYQQTPGRLGFKEWALAHDRVRFAGEPVAMVVAADRYVAEDVADLVDVSYDVLDPVTDVYAASDDEVLLHEETGTNLADRDEFVFGDVEGAFEDADNVVEGEYSWGRISGVPMETAGAVADYDSDTDSFDVHCNLQLYTFNGELVYESLGYPAEKVRLHVPENIGGSFGTKIAAGARYCALAAMASHQLERPVKYVEDRIEYLQAGDSHSCEREYSVRLAVDDDGTIRGYDVSFMDDLGAFPRYPLPQAVKPLSVLSTSYHIDTVRYEYELYLTNKVPQTAYRGFGVQQHTFALEMTLEKAARELGVDPTELRRQNLVRPDEMPYELPSKNIYDSGDYPAALARIEELVDERERCEGGLLDPDVVEAKREEGKYRGTRPAVTLEPSAGVIDYASRFEMSDDEIEANTREDVASFPEHLAADLRPDGTVTVHLATSSAGQGHQTVVIQLMADGLGISPADIDVDYLNSAEAPKDFGAAASRMGIMLSGASVGLADELATVFEGAAATHWGCDPADVTYADGAVTRDGGGDSLSLADLAEFVDDDGHTATYGYENPAFDLPEFDDALVDKLPTYPGTAYCADAPIVEVDVNTGHVDILRYYSLHDCGTVLNPDIVQGQVEGAIAHGIGGALLEEFAYDDSGQPLAVTMFDYLLPSITNVPEMVVEHRETPSPFTVTGAKGAGEGGTISASAVIPTSINAALEPLGVTVDTVPVTPDRLRAKLRDEVE
ncbi:xanthine dehydrogenase family protein molybdopterin-binding subunit [Halogeometricum limi]|uniref:Carbon-monoxide dehydrogenase large subunit n=1 Tax=Halogeometricum limi TaxID=555875 RepID=A0A1I6ICH4_9EURY|nr:xanthine dehydrogenase family protein molybdopterin-binding subunit [Halogeometricum limi]SFR64386.1 carbon-monoxide dehydrogenase large subunit [Halogeometricum limi]